MSKMSKYYIHIITVIVCPEPAQVLNANVSYTSLQYGSTATYSCNEGYSTDGDLNVLCTGEGLWDGILPVCTSKCHFIQDFLNYLNRIGFF